MNCLTDWKTIKYEYRFYVHPIVYYVIVLYVFHRFLIANDLCEIHNTNTRACVGRLKKIQCVRTWLLAFKDFFLLIKTVYGKNIFNIRNDPKIKVYDTQLNTYSSKSLDPLNVSSYRPLTYVHNAKVYNHLLPDIDLGSSWRYSGDHCFGWSIAVWWPESVYVTAPCRSTWTAANIG